MVEKKGFFFLNLQQRDGKKILIDIIMNFVQRDFGEQSVTWCGDGMMKYIRENARGWMKKV